MNSNYREPNRSDKLIDTKKKPTYRRRDSSSSSSSDSSESPRRLEDLCADLKFSLEKGDYKQVQSIVKDLSRSSKEEFGILRVSIANTFEFHKNDIEEFFGRFGRVENVIIKESKSKEAREQSLDEKQKGKQSEHVAYIIFSQHYSAVVALRVLQSISEKDRIVEAKICYTDQSIFEEETQTPILGQLSQADLTLNIEQDDDLLKASESFRYVSTIGIDLDDKQFYTKDRILGVKGCNLLRIYYLCQKAARFENEAPTQINDLKLKLINHKNQDTQRSIAIFSNNLLKYNTALRSAHELFEQIVEEYKNSREKSQQIIPKDIHIRRWQKIKAEPTLKFLQPKAQ